MAKIIERIRNVFDDHLKTGRRETTVVTQDGRQGRSAEEERGAAQVSILQQNLLEDVKNRWISDLSAGVAPGVAMAFAAGRLEQFNSNVAYRAAAIEVGALQAEVEAIAKRLRGEHLQAVIQANREAFEKRQQQSQGIKV